MLKLLHVLLNYQKENDINGHYDYIGDHCIPYLLRHLFIRPQRQLPKNEAINIVKAPVDDQGQDIHHRVCLVVRIDVDPSDDKVLSKGKAEILDREKHDSENF